MYEVSYPRKLWNTLSVIMSHIVDIGLNSLLCDYPLKMKVTGPCVLDKAVYCLKKIKKKHRKLTKICYILMHSNSQLFVCKFQQDYNHFSNVFKIIIEVLSVSSKIKLSTAYLKMMNVWVHKFTEIFDLIFAVFF